MRLLSILILLSQACGSAVTVDLDATSTDAAPVADNIAPPADATAGPYSVCTAGSCPTGLACLDGICTGSCVGFSTEECPDPTIGSQTVCVRSRCMLACWPEYMCPAGTRCQTIDGYAVCAP